MKITVDFDQASGKAQVCLDEAHYELHSAQIEVAHPHREKPVYHGFPEYEPTGEFVLTITGWTPR